MLEITGLLVHQRFWSCCVATSVSPPSLVSETQRLVAAVIDTFKR